MFQKGQSGNPAGKPKGKDKRAELRELLRSHAPARVEKAVELALNGDLTALKLCLDRLMLPLKATAELVVPLLPGEPLLEKGQAILMAVSEGRVIQEAGYDEIKLRGGVLVSSRVCVEGIGLIMAETSPASDCPPSACRRIFGPPKNKRLTSNGGQASRCRIL